MSERTRASRLETLGAWLHLWTPPRDCDVPPVPWRKVAAGAAVLAALGVVLALAVAPAIDDAKREGAAEERAAAAKRGAARRERMRIEQQPRTGRLTDVAPRSSALALVAAVIGRDARERFGANGAPAACDVTPGEDAAARRVVFDCFATVREIIGAGDQEGARGALAIPYRAVLDFGARRYAFCKVNPPPAEQAVPDPRTVVGVPPACRRR